jgi:hypothetical protein
LSQSSRYKPINDALTFTSLRAVSASLSKSAISKKILAANQMVSHLCALSGFLMFSQTDVSKTHFYYFAGL